MTWFDVHTHLNMLDMTPEEAIEKAKAAGLEKVITIGTGPDDHQLVMDLAEKYKPFVYCTLGVHPHEAELFTEEIGDFILQHAPKDRVVAVGEIGLDFYYDNAPREIQKAAFIRQLEIAEELKLPVEIHTRDAEPETVEILETFKGRVKGLFHCFTGTQWLAEKGLDLGFDISFSGVVTFKNADALREVVKFVPLDRMHVETDAPFLTPVPHRGQKNHPAFVTHTAQLVADLKAVPLERLAEQTRANGLRLFQKLV